MCLNFYDDWDGSNHYIYEMIEYIHFLLYNPNPEDAYGDLGEEFTNKGIQYEKNVNKRLEILIKGIGIKYLARATKLNLNE